MRHFIVVAMIAAGLSLPGCGYVPPVWDIDDAIHKFDQIEEGTTTREEVLKLLGEPDWERENVIRYFGSASAGYIILGAGGFGTPSHIPLFEEPWLIKVTFDEDGVVREASSTEGRDALHREWVRLRGKEALEEPETREELELRARQGDAEAQYEMGRQYAVKAYRSQVQIAPAWKWTCLAAHNNHGKAQHRVGYWYSEDRSTYWSALDIATDNATAYMWYSLASSNGFSFKGWLKDKLAKRMTPPEIAEAERLVREWKPDPSACEVEAASSS